MSATLCATCGNSWQACYCTVAPAAGTPPREPYLKCDECGRITYNLKVMGQIHEDCDRHGAWRLVNAAPPSHSGAPEVIESAAVNFPPRREIVRIAPSAETPPAPPTPFDWENEPHPLIALSFVLAQMGHVDMAGYLTVHHFDHTSLRASLEASQRENDTLRATHEAATDYLAAWDKHGHPKSADYTNCSWYDVARSDKARKALRSTLSPVEPT